MSPAPKPTEEPNKHLTQPDSYFDNGRLVYTAA